MSERLNTYTGVMIAIVLMLTDDRQFGFWSKPINWEYEYVGQLGERRNNGQSNVRQYSIYVLVFHPSSNSFLGMTYFSIYLRCGESNVSLTHIEYSAASQIDTRSDGISLYFSWWEQFLTRNQNEQLLFPQLLEMTAPFCLLRYSLYLLSTYNLLESQRISTLYYYSYWCFKQC